MRTEVEKITPSSLQKAKRLLEEGEIVAFPTETVYGLGANARDDEAVRKIYEIKGRPRDNPLIVHIHEGFPLEEIVSTVPDYARLLAAAFLPGPLTMVYEGRGNLADVSAGLSTVAVRVPSSPAAQEFLKFVGLPVAAPSANVSKHVSPTSASHVLSDLDGKIPLILDGGECSVGIESTVLDCTGPRPRVLRPGMVTREMIETVVPCDDCMPTGERPASPGMKYAHYMPRCATLLFREEDLDAGLRRYDEETSKGKRAYVLAFESCREMIGERNFLSLGETASDGAERLYGLLREAESLADVLVGVAPKKRDGAMESVMNRFLKAFGGEYEED